MKDGLCEADFIRQIHAEFATPGTCVLGYNSIRFDDEVTRYTLYRNFYDPMPTPGRTATPAGTSSTCCGPATPCARRG